MPVQPRAEEVQADGVEVGRVLGAWGVKGAIKVQPFCGDPQALLASRHWVLKPPQDLRAPRDMLPVGLAAGLANGSLSLRVSQVREQSGSLVARAQDVDDRDAAESLRGWRILVARSDFPALEAGEYYWVDLIGLDVFNRSHESLGRVLGLVDTGAHPVLRVGPAASAEETGRTDPPERLIPFVDAYVDEVDLPGRCIRVDWSRDWDGS